MKAPNVLLARVVKHGRVYNISHIMEMKSFLVIETGKHGTMTRRDFRKWIKELGGTFLPQLKLGEYINIKTNKVEKLYGID